MITMHVLQMAGSGINKGDTISLTYSSSTMARPGSGGGGIPSPPSWHKYMSELVVEYTLLCYTAIQGLLGR